VAKCSGQVQTSYYSESTTELKSPCFHTLILGQCNIEYAPLLHMHLKVSRWFYTYCCYDPVPLTVLIRFSVPKEVLEIYFKGFNCILPPWCNASFVYNYLQFSQNTSLKLELCKIHKRKITIFMLIQYPLRWLNVLDRSSPDNIQNQHLSWWAPVFTPLSWDSSTLSMHHCFTSIQKSLDDFTHTAVKTQNP
jgi:hypothetical protein